MDVFGVVRYIAGVVLEAGKTAYKAFSLASKDTDQEIREVREGEREEEPKTGVKAFFSKTWKVVSHSRIFDIMTSPTVGRMVTLASAVVVFFTNPFGPVVAGAILGLNLATLMYSATVEAIAYRDLRNSQLNNAVMDALLAKSSGDPALQEKLAVALKQNNLERSYNDVALKREATLMHSTKKTLLFKCFDRITSIASAILCMNPLTSATGAACALMEFGIQVKMQHSFDKNKAEMQRRDDNLRHALSLSQSANTKDLLRVYRDYTGVDFSHKPVGFGSALKAVVLQHGFSAKGSIASCDALHNPYVKQPVIDPTMFISHKEIVRTPVLEEKVVVQEVSIKVEQERPARVSSVQEILQARASQKVTDSREFAARLEQRPRSRTEGGAFDHVQSEQRRRDLLQGSGKQVSRS